MSDIALSGLICVVLYCIHIIAPLIKTCMYKGWPIWYPGGGGGGLYFIGSQIFVCVYMKAI